MVTCCKNIEANQVFNDENKKEPLPDFKNIKNVIEKKKCSGFYKVKKKIVNFFQVLLKII